MIQEKDFLYRVPVKTAPITTPGGQIRNPEILVDLEGGEFMHGNILDANSTNKLVNQSVKEAVDNKIIEGGYVTKDLLEAETTRATEQENSLKTLIGAETGARTKGDEDLSSKIKAEQTRAEGKEKEISDKLAIVNGDSNTEGSFRKAIADVVAAAPEDLDTLKEIADKLAGNDDLHTALNQAITEKADASALLNEVTRATGVENNLKTAIATKADATALSNYVLTTALNKKVDTLNAAISAKQDAGNYIPFEKRDLNDDYAYIITPSYYIECRTDKFDDGKYNYSVMNSQFISVYNASGNSTRIDFDGIVVSDGGDASNEYHLSLSPSNISSRSNSSSHSLQFQLNSNGVKLEGGRDDKVLTSNGSTIYITEYAKKTELPTVPTKTSQLTNDSNFMAANVVQDTYFGLEKELKIYSEADNKIMTIGHTGIEFETDKNNVSINDSAIDITSNKSSNKTKLGLGFITFYYNDNVVKFSSEGIRSSKFHDCLATSDGTFIPLSEFVDTATYDSKIAALEARITALETKHAEATA